jgi:hypothetical protein
MGRNIKILRLKTTHHASKRILQRSKKQYSQTFLCTHVHNNRIASWGKTFYFRNLLKYFTLLQRCHVCGRTDETCKPCPYCNWWFCGQHLDPEQHDCTGLKIMGKPVDASKPEKQETLVPRALWILTDLATGSALKKTRQ